VILAALTASCLFALAWPQPKPITCYLYAKLLGNLTLFAINALLGDSSNTYLVCYLLVTGIILLAVAGIVLDGIRSAQNSFKPLGPILVLSGALIRLATLALGHPAHIQDMVGIAEGAFLFAAGMSYGCLAPYLERTYLALVLGGLWIAQAFWRIGLYVHLPAWRSFDWRVPPLLGVIAYLLLGLLGWKYQRSAHQSVARQP
jgi:hypothetical protein